MPLPFTTQLHVIHLQNRNDRRENFEKEFAAQGINYRLWNGITEHSTSAKNVNCAHRQIVQWAKDNNQPFVIIAEDDIVFSAPGAWQYFLSKIPDPKDFDLFFSMVYSAEIQEGRIINGFSGLTMYAVSNQFYDFFLSIPDHVHIDRHLGQFSYEKRYFIIEPYVCLQTGGMSDNLKRIMFYEAYTDSMKFYGREGQKFYRGEWIDEKVIQ